MICPPTSGTGRLTFHVNTGSITVTLVRGTVHSYTCTVCQCLTGRSKNKREGMDDRSRRAENARNKRPSGQATTQGTGHGEDGSIDVPYCSSRSASWVTHQASSPVKSSTHPKISEQLDLTSTRHRSVTTPWPLTIVTDQLSSHSLGGRMF
jgi:hypothetical protein